MADAMDTVTFTSMAEGTKEDYELLERLEAEFAEGTAERVLTMLLDLSGSLSGYQVDRLEHSLQCATRAHRDGADEEMVVAALLHDIGDLLSPFNHSELAAAVLRPYVSERTYWIVSPPWPVPELLLRPPFGRRPQRPGRLSRPSLVPGHGGLLPPLGPVLPSTPSMSPCRWSSLCPWCSASSAARPSSRDKRQTCGGPS